VHDWFWVQTQPTPSAGSHAAVTFLPLKRVQGYAQATGIVASQSSPALGNLAGHVPVAGVGVAAGAFTHESIPPVATSPVHWHSTVA